MSTGRPVRARRAPERFTYSSMDEIVIGKEERKFRDPDDLKCESDSDDDSVGSLVEFVASDAESLTDVTQDDDEDEFQDNETETDTDTDTEEKCEPDEDEPLEEPEPMEIDDE